MRRLTLGLVLYTLSGLWLPAAQAEARVFALIVTSNRGIDVAQPPLSYADDDGVRYFQLFRAAARAAEDVKLLTTFDASTRAAYTDLESAARPPVWNEVKAAIAELATQVSAARATGEQTALYFVFAGHGEVRDGRGHLGLEDSTMDGYFIEHEVIERIPAHAKHIVLDSCNSFFVINPRKPGGRRWATPDDMTFGFSARHPEVGVFLSTNAEEEVFEWSRLESGVFSHEVRSGLRGAADVNNDAKVSYSELAGFVARANEGIVRESLRPHLFFRGPQNKHDAVLFDVAGLRGDRLALQAGQTRAWVADARGERVLDLHKEAGPLMVVLPSDQGELALVSKAAGSLSETRAFVVEGRGSQLALRETTTEISARGMSVFGELFGAPYGPIAYRDYRARVPPPSQQLFGLSEDDTKRAGFYLKEIARASGQTRRRRASLAMAMAAPLLFAGAIELSSHPRPWLVGVEGGLGLTLVAVGLAEFLARSPGEETFGSMRQKLALGPKAGLSTFSEAGSKLIAWEKRLRRRRLISAGLAIALTVSCASLLAVVDSEEVWSYAREHRRVILPVLAAGMTFGIVAAIWQIIMPSAEERLISMYRRDPLLSVQLSADNRGAALGMRRAF